MVGLYVVKSDSAVQVMERGTRFGFRRGTGQEGAASDSHASYADRIRPD